MKYLGLFLFASLSFSSMAAAETFSCEFENTGRLSYNGKTIIKIQTGDKGNEAEGAVASFSNGEGLLKYIDIQGYGSDDKSIYLFISTGLGSGLDFTLPLKDAFANSEEILVDVVQTSSGFAGTSKEKLAVTCTKIVESTFVSLEDWKASDKQKKYVMTLIQKAGAEVSNIWYDTILEGDYILSEDEDIEISNIEVELENGKAKQFHAHVSHAAYLTAVCDYNDEIDGYDESCLEEYSGSITEGFIVNWRGEVLDSDNYAEFDN